jgi:hypothetical protein
MACPRSSVSPGRGPAGILVENKFLFAKVHCQHVRPHEPQSRKMFANFFRTRPKHKHAPLPQRDSECLDTETLLSSSPSEASLPDNTRALSRSSRDIRIAVRTLALCTVIYLGAGLWLISSLRYDIFVADVDDTCLHHVSRYSPLVREIKPGWHDRQFNGSFLHLNEFRQPAGPEVDAACASLGVNCKCRTSGHWMVINESRSKYHGTFGRG